MLYLCHIWLLLLADATISLIPPSATLHCLQEANLRSRETCLRSRTLASSRLWPTRFIGFTAFGTVTSYITVILTIFGIISITRSLYYTKYLALNTVQTGKRVAEQQKRYSPMRAKQWMGSYTIHCFFPHPPNYQKWPLWRWTVYYTSIASKYLELISLVLVMILMNR